MLRILKQFILTTSMLLACGLAYAKDINLYDQPDNKAKVIGAVDLTAGIIPILTPKEGTWVKVADPRNGNVGWIKSTEMNSGGKQPDNVTFTQRIINDGNGPQTYQIIQYGGQTKKLNAGQVQQMVQRMQMQHKALQDSMQKAVQEMVKDMNSLYQNDWAMLQKMPFPMIMPIVIIPESSPQKHIKPAAQPSTKKQA